MPTPTYTPLANITLGSAAASVSFSSISQAYRDLILVINYGETAQAGDVKLQFNSDTGTNYSLVFAAGRDGNSTQSAAGTFGFHYLNMTSRPAGLVNNAVVQIMDYSATDKHKSSLGRINLGSDNVAAYAYRWASTSAITTIVVSESATTFTAGSSFALYGVAA